MEKKVSDELYVRFNNRKNEIYEQYPLSNRSESPTEEAFLRANLDVLKKRAGHFREVMPEIVKFEKKTYRRDGR